MSEQGGTQDAGMTRSGGVGKISDNKETRPYYTLLQKVLDAKVPYATMTGGSHRLDLNVAEYAELRKQLFDGGEDFTDGKSK